MSVVTPESRFDSRLPSTVSASSSIIIIIIIITLIILKIIIWLGETVIVSHLKNAIQTLKCEPCQLNKSSTPFLTAVFHLTQPRPHDWKRKHGRCLVFNRYAPDRVNFRIVQRSRKRIPWRIGIGVNSPRTFRLSSNLWNWHRPF